MATATTDTFDAASLQALLGPQLTAEQASLIFQQGQEAVVFALLSLAKLLAEKQAVATTPDPSHVRADSPLRQAARQRPSQVQGGQARTSRQSSPDAASDRRSPGSHP